MTDTPDTTGTSAADGDVAAVVVTHDRIGPLAESLRIVAGQTRAPRWLIVVDNGDDHRVKALLEGTCSEHPGVEPVYVGSKTNLGGAGGFALGMLTALSLGADWVWCADDDGRPDGPRVLCELMACADRHGLEAVSPVVCDIDDASMLAFPLRRGLGWRRERAELHPDGNPRPPVAEDADGYRWFVNFADHRAATGRDLPEGVELVDPEHDLLPGIASLFNGALLSARTLQHVGVPDYRLFIRGDEVEFHRRLVRSGLPFGTCLTAAYLHPNGRDEFRPILGGAMHAQYPDNEFKRYFTYRNRGYLMNQPGMRRLLPQEYARFAWYFLVQNRDVPGFVRWAALQRRGRKERFAPFVPQRKRG
ncbi:glycosyltransferase [Corynebacterium sp. 335C]